jgi:allantoin racemase
MRLLLYNPNSDAGLTSLLGQAVSPLLDRKDTIGLATAEQGPRFIGSAEAVAAARETLTARLAESARKYDAVILGCFGDLGIEPLRQMVDKPILSLWDACVSLAPVSGKRFGVVTTSQFWVDRLQSDISRRGLSHCIRAVRAISLSPLASSDAL